MRYSSKEKVGHHGSGRSRWRWPLPILAGLMVLANGGISWHSAGKEIGPALNMLLLSGPDQPIST